MSIPSIAGYESWGFKKHFWANVEKDPITELPIRGTLGIDYNVHVSLRDLAFGPGISQQSLQDFYQGDAHRGDGLAKRNGKFSHKQAQIMAEFYKFAQGNQLYFFLRQGKKCIGLCRKTSGYIYKPREGAWKGHVYMHRISFEFIRPATPEEQIQTDMLPIIPMTLEWIPMPKEALAVPEIDTRAERIRLNQELKCLATLLSSIQARQERLNI